MVKCAGQISIVEQRNAFQALDPDDHRRPDISVISENESVMHLDVSVTCPIPLGPTRRPSRRDAFTVNRAADAAKSKKGKEYASSSAACGASFTPLIFELTGRPDDEVESLVKKFSEIEARGQMTRWDVIYRFWMARISVTFQYYLASALLNRTRNIIRESTKATRIISPDTIEEFQYTSAYNDIVTRHLGSGGTLTWSMMTSNQSGGDLENAGPRSRGRTVTTYRGYFY